MRSYASDTALPGGKYEDGDEDEEGTAVCPLTQSHDLPLIDGCMAEKRGARGGEIRKRCQS